MGAEMNEREALKLALEALEEPKEHIAKHRRLEAILAIKEVLAQPEFVLNGIDCSCGRKWRVVNNTLTASEQPEQKPVACPFPCGWKRLFEIIVADGAFLARSLEEGEAITEHQREVVMHMIGYAKDMALHGMKATPPQRTWVGLTEEDKNNCLVSADPCECLAKPESHQLMEDVEAKLREKNGC